ncbi:hypothetical protein T03_13099 [Trichinella britovi]|uniref:Uncharacterized protein n=1 Tax=Trichinella britovi TaxID=45882 RepID=A0A0V0YPZ3_TRIBR|nr:hypothetical protein T03_13099 [Trichinella britovi]
MSLVHEGRAYKLKRGSRQKYWRRKRAVMVPFGPTLMSQR